MTPATSDEKADRTNPILMLLAVPATTFAAAAFCRLHWANLPRLRRVVSLHELHGLLAGSLLAAGIGLGLVIAIYLAGRAAQSNRERLLRLFRPGLYLTLVTLALLVVVNAALALVTFYYAELTLIGSIHPFILLSIGGGALFGVVTMLRACALATRRARADVAGVTLSRDQAGGLWALVDEIAATLGALRPDNLVVGLEPNFFVTEGDVRCFSGSLSGRTLYCSLPLCRVLAQTELRSILGHELGHYKGLDTQFSRHFFPIYRGSLFSLVTLYTEAQGWSRIAVLPAIAVLGYFLESFGTAERELSRSRELAADQEAAAVAGVHSTGTALLKVHAFALAWTAVAEIAGHLVRDAKMAGNLAQVFQDAVVRGTPFVPMAALVDARLSHPTDSHPPLAARLDSLHLGFDDVLAAAHDVNPAEPAVRLVADAEGIEIELSRTYQMGLAQRLGVKAKTLTPTPVTIEWQASEARPEPPQPNKSTGA